MMLKLLLVYCSKVFGANVAPTLAPLRASSGSEAWCERGVTAPSEMPTFIAEVLMVHDMQQPSVMRIFFLPHHSQLQKHSHFV